MADPLTTVLGRILGEAAARLGAELPAEELYSDEMQRYVRSQLAEALAPGVPPLAAYPPPSPVERFPGVDVAPPLELSGYVPLSAIKAWERGHYFAEDGTKIAGSQTTPMGEVPWPAGTWRRDDGTLVGYGHDIEQLRLVDPKDVRPVENTEDDRSRMEDVERYAGWLREGKTPPPILCVTSDAGLLILAGEGHRRRLAALRVGVPLLAWVQDAVWTGRYKAGGGRMYTGLTYELVVPLALRPTGQESMDLERLANLLRARASWQLPAAVQEAAAQAAALPRPAAPERYETVEALLQSQAADPVRGAAARGALSLSDVPAQRLRLLPVPVAEAILGRIADEQLPGAPEKETAAAWQTEIGLYGKQHKASRGRLPWPPVFSNEMHDVFEQIEHLGTDGAPSDYEDGALRLRIDGAEGRWYAQVGPERFGPFMNHYKAAGIVLDAAEQAYAYRFPQSVGKLEEARKAAAARVDKNAVHRAAEDRGQWETARIKQKLEADKGTELPAALAGLLFDVPLPELLADPERARPLVEWDWQARGTSDWGPRLAARQVPIYPEDIEDAHRQAHRVLLVTRQLGPIQAATVAGKGAVRAKLAAAEAVKNGPLTPERAQSILAVAADTRAGLRKGELGVGRVMDTARAQGYQESFRAWLLDKSPLGLRPGPSFDSFWQVFEWEPGIYEQSDEDRAEAGADLAEALKAAGLTVTAEDRAVLDKLPVPAHLPGVPAFRTFLAQHGAKVARDAGDKGVAVEISYPDGQGGDTLILKPGMFKPKDEVFGPGGKATVSKVGRAQVPVTAASVAKVALGLWRRIPGDEAVRDEFTKLGYAEVQKNAPALTDKADLAPLLRDLQGGLGPDRLDLAWNAYQAGQRQAEADAQRLEEQLTARAPALPPVGVDSTRTGAAAGLTELESDVILHGFGDSDFGDGGETGVWSEVLVDTCRLVTPSQIGGVVSSLVKKDLARAWGTGKDATVELTDKGREALRALQGGGRATPPPEPAPALPAAPPPLAPPVRVSAALTGPAAGLTDLEQDVILNGFGHNVFFRESEGGAVWSDSLIDSCRLVTPAQLGGVVSSLVKKGLAQWAGGTGKDATIELTEAGHEALRVLRAAEEAAPQTLPAPAEPRTATAAPSDREVFASGGFEAIVEAAAPGSPAKFRLLFRDANATITDEFHDDRAHLVAKAKQLVDVFASAKPEGEASPPPSPGLTPAAEPDRAVFTNAAYGVEAVVEPAGPARPGMFRLRFRDIDEDATIGIEFHADRELLVEKAKSYVDGRAPAKQPALALGGPATQAPPPPPTIASPPSPALAAKLADLSNLGSLTLSPREATELGWERVDPEPRTKLSARWAHRDGWTLEHCGHQTALYPWLLKDPKGRVHKTGLVFGGPDPDHGRAFSTLALAFGYVLNLGKKGMEALDRLDAAAAPAPAGPAPVASPSAALPSADAAEAPPSADAPRGPLESGPFDEFTDERPTSTQRAALLLMVNEDRPLVALPGGRKWAAELPEGQRRRKEDGGTYPAANTIESLRTRFWIGDLPATEGPRRVWITERGLAALFRDYLGSSDKERVTQLRARPALRLDRGETHRGPSGPLKTCKEVLELAGFVFAKEGEQKLWQGKRGAVAQLVKDGPDTAHLEITGPVPAWPAPLADAAPRSEVPTLGRTSEALWLLRGLVDAGRPVVDGKKPSTKRIGEQSVEASAVDLCTREGFIAPLPTGVGLWLTRHGLQTLLAAPGLSSSITGERARRIALLPDAPSAAEPAAAPIPSPAPSAAEPAAAPIPSPAPSAAEPAAAPIPSPAPSAAEPAAAPIPSPAPSAAEPAAAPIPSPAPSDAAPGPDWSKVTTVTWYTKAPAEFDIPGVVSVEESFSVAGVPWRKVQVRGDSYQQADQFRRYSSSEPGSSFDAIFTDVDPRLSVASAAPAAAETDQAVVERLVKLPREEALRASLDDQRAAVRWLFTMKEMNDPATIDQLRRRRWGLEVDPENPSAEPLFYKRALDGARFRSAEGRSLAPERTPSATAPPPAQRVIFTTAPAALDHSNVATELEAFTAAEVPGNKPVQWRKVALAGTQTQIDAQLGRYGSSVPGAMKDIDPRETFARLSAEADAQRAYEERDLADLQALKALSLEELRAEVERRYEMEPRAGMLARARGVLEGEEAAARAMAAVKAMAPPDELVPTLSFDEAMKAADRLRSRYALLRDRAAEFNLKRLSWAKLQDLFTEYGERITRKDQVAQVVERLRQELAAADAQVEAAGRLGVLVKAMDAPTLALLQSIERTDKAAPGDERLPALLSQGLILASTSTAGRYGLTEKGHAALRLRKESPEGRRDQLRRDLLGIASGTLASLTGQSEYSTLDTIQAELLAYFEAQHAAHPAWSSWQQVWDAFWAQRQAPAAPAAEPTPSLWSPEPEGRGVEYCGAEYVSAADAATPAQQHVRALAKLIKDPAAPPEAFAEAARAIVPCVPSGTVLVPIPDSRGDTSANLKLAQAVQAAVPGRVVAVEDLLTRTEPVESSFKRRLSGRRGLLVAEHKMALRRPLAAPFKPEDVVFIDNIFVSGHTLGAAVKALGGGTGLAYARAENKDPARPPEAAPASAKPAAPRPRRSPDLDKLRAGREDAYLDKIRNFDGRHASLRNIITETVQAGGVSLSYSGGWGAKQDGLRRPTPPTWYLHRPGGALDVGKMGARFAASLFRAPVDLEEMERAGQEVYENLKAHVESERLPHPERGLDYPPASPARAGESLRDQDAREKAELRALLSTARSLDVNVRELESRAYSVIGLDEPTQEAVDAAQHNWLVSELRTAIEAAEAEAEEAAEPPAAASSPKVTHVTLTDAARAFIDSVRSGGLSEHALKQRLDEWVSAQTEGLEREVAGAERQLQRHRTAAKNPGNLAETVEAQRKVRESERHLLQLRRDTFDNDAQRALIVAELARQELRPVMQREMQARGYQVGSMAPDDDATLTKAFDEQLGALLPELLTTLWGTK